MTGGTITGNLQIGANNIRCGSGTINNFFGSNQFTQIMGGNSNAFSVNQISCLTNTDINMSGNDIFNCESITCQGSVLTLSAGGAGAFRVTNTLSDSLVPIRMNTNKITTLGAPTADTDAATKKYVDDNLPVVRYIDFTENGFSPTGTEKTFVCTLPSIIPDGDYMFEFEIYLKYQDNDTNADGFKFLAFPLYSVAPLRIKN